MKINVKLFAVARERVSASAINVDLPPGASVHKLRGAIAAQYPELKEIMPHIRFAVNSEYAGDTTIISPNSEIAAIPPVSGG